MKLSRISSAPYRPHVKRMSKSELRSIFRINNIDSRSASITKLPHLSSAPHGACITTMSQKYPSSIRHGRSLEPQCDLRLVRHDKNVETRTGAIGKFSRMLSTSSRSRITPINKREFGSIDQAKSISSGTTWPNTNSTYMSKSISVPIFNDHSNILDHHCQENKKRKRYLAALTKVKRVFVCQIIYFVRILRFTRRPAVPIWFLLCCLLLTGLLLATIAGILLAVLLPKPSVPILSTITSTTSTSSTSTSSTASTSTTSTSTVTTTSTSTVSTTSTSQTTSTTSKTTTTSVSTSTSTTATTTTVTTCNGGTGFTFGFLGTESGKNPLTYTQYNYTYVAATTAPILTLAFVTDSGNNYFLDTISVTQVSTPSVELLQNPSFENSTTQLNGWVLWCNSTCSAGAGGQVTYGTNCYAALGNCFLADCPDTGNGGAMVFLGQSFSAIVGNTYAISFRLHMAYGNGAFSLTQFTAAIQ